MKYLKFSLITCLSIFLSVNLLSSQEITQKSEKTSSCTKAKEVKVASAVMSSDDLVSKTEKKSCNSAKEAKVASAMSEVEIVDGKTKKSCTMSKAECKKATSAKVASASQEKEIEKKACASKKEKSKTY